MTTTFPPGTRVVARASGYLRVDPTGLACVVNGAQVDFVLDQCIGEHATLPGGGFLDPDTGAQYLPLIGKRPLDRPYDAVAFPGDIRRKKVFLGVSPRKAATQMANAPGDVHALASGAYIAIRAGRIVARWTPSKED